ncbi:hypothetical protein VII00023_21934 [Vibrio ichthyoenteri ATCC 700023]|uniref:Uncharacterized protein n=1 Tax=Vibrio ichthyoenteri ATCC 700023 TaxID=870968 RepID=F9S6H1_9VIBR|nr:hypothetical protein [Vibrio ichthyoenteri]EGU33286.1 hypothetical protein VII00023_21934 [Vibrio ichthyoenteri ATCC 700023]
MSEFDKTVFISVDPHDPDSIASALREYRQRLVDGTAFRLHMNTLFNIEFVDPSGRALKVDDAGANRNLVNRVFNAYRMHEKKKYVSEPVLFACALNFPQLQPELELTAQAMVDFSRSRNDYGDLMLSANNLFGIEALFLLAKVNPAHSFYLSSFVVPYWNTESWTVPFDMLMALVDELGWSRDLIKAYIWSDAENLRRHFYMDRDGYQHQTDLLSHFVAHPEDYPWFKQQLIKRLSQQPLLSTPGWDLEHPTLSFYYSLGLWQVEAPYYQHEEYQDQVKQQLILGLRVDEEAIGLLEQIEAEYPGVNLSQVPASCQQENRYEQWEHTRIRDEEPEEEEETPLEEVWSEQEWRSCYLPLNPRLEKITQSRLDNIDDKIKGLDELISEHLPTHLGGCLYATWRLNDHMENEPEEYELIEWLEEHLPMALTDPLIRFSELDKAQKEEVRTWLTQVDCASDDAQMITLLGSRLFCDGGRAGDMISPTQPAYALLNHYDGYQRAILTLFWLMEAFASGELESDLAILVKRHWQLWNAIAPQSVIEHVFSFWADYPLYAVVNSVELEQQISERLHATGVAQADIDVYLLLAYQDVASYRPADARFWQYYCERVKAFAWAESDDNSMIGRHQWAEREKLLKSFERCYPSQIALFFQHARVVNPAVELPIENWFQSTLITALIKKLDEEKATKISAQILDYLESGEGGESLSPEALGVPKLQGWDPYASYRKQVGPSDLIWLLPEKKAQRLAVFFSQLGKRGLHWVCCHTVEDAYVAQRIINSEVSLTERWSDEHLGHNTISKESYGMALLYAQEEWALDWLDRAGVSELMLLHFATHEARKPANFVQRLAKEGRIPDLQEWLTVENRLKLLEMLASGDITSYRTSLEAFLCDDSIQVRRAVEKLLESQN